MSDVKPMTDERLSAMRRHRIEHPSFVGMDSDDFDALVARLDAAEKGPRSEIPQTLGITAQLDGDTPVQRYWNIFDGPELIARAVERKHDSPSLHPIQIIRGEVNHTVAVIAIDAAKRAQRAKMKGGLE